MRRLLSLLLVLVAVVAAAPASAQAVSFPSEIRGTIAGFDNQDGVNVKWTGTLVLKRRKVDPVTKTPDFEPTYEMAPGTSISWTADLGGGCTGHGTGTLLPADLDGVLTISKERDAKSGYPWSLLIVALPPEGEQQRMPVSGTCPGPEDEPVAVTVDARLETAYGYNGYNPGNAHPENTHTKDLKTFKGLGQATGTYGNQHWEWDLKAAGNLTAVPKAKAVTRGDTATLDGSKSTKQSRIEKYVWEFAEVPGACPDGAAPDDAARLKGRKVKIVALCDLQVTLTVSDGHGDSDEASTVLKVKPRKWRTPFDHRERASGPGQPKDPPSVTALGNNTFAFSFFGGLNISDCGEPTAASVILCPKLHGTRSWLDEGYDLKRVDDPGGPFDDQFYVVHPSLNVKRAALINPTILPGSEFYAHNKAAGTDVAGFLAAVRQHEGLGSGAARTGHSQIIRDLLKVDATNPRRAIEATFGPGKSGVAKKADARLHEVDGVLDQQSDDPLSDIWTGTLEVFDSYQSKWIRGEGIRVPGNSAHGRG